MPYWEDGTAAPFRQMLRERKVSLDAVSKIAGTSRQHVGDAARGKRPPNAKVVTTLCAMLEAPPSKLLTDRQVGCLSVALYEELEASYGGNGDRTQVAG
jgi:transcriptional regulator with XRE-family HTH domain